MLNLHRISSRGGIWHGQQEWKAVERMHGWTARGARKNWLALERETGRQSCQRWQRLVYIASARSPTVYRAKGAGSIRGRDKPAQRVAVQRPGRTWGQANVARKQVGKRGRHGRGRCTVSMYHHRQVCVHRRIGRRSRGFRRCRCAARQSDRQGGASCVDLEVQGCGRLPRSLFCIASAPDVSCNAGGGNAGSRARLGGAQMSRK